MFFLNREELEDGVVSITMWQIAPQIGVFNVIISAKSMQCHSQLEVTAGQNFSYYPLQSLLRVLHRYWVDYAF